MSQATAGSASGKEAKELAVLIGAGADASALAAYLDGLSPEARVNEVQGLPRSLLQLLYECCKGAPALSLQDMVPANVEPGQTVIFAGINNLPLFRKFEKRFTRTKAGAIIGFNFQTMSPFTGPGYFTVLPASAPYEGELLFDYTQVPSAGEAPADWPTVRSNAAGLSHFIYKNMHDFCRRVSRDVVIGHATRLGKSMPQYFALARRSPA
jgi:hypothetical protein